jgi:hypothetical protein
MQVADAVRRAGAPDRVVQHAGVIDRGDADLARAARRQYPHGTG